MGGSVSITLMNTILDIWHDIFNVWGENRMQASNAIADLKFEVNDEFLSGSCLIALDREISYIILSCQLGL